jgi:CubicO group peptidase (beta-lactamase class C family)
MEDLFQAYEVRGRMSGIVLVTGPGGLSYARTMGLADRGRGIRVELNTQYNIASVGKVLTATLVMRLVEQGALGLHSPIGEYLGGTGSQLAGRDSITLHHLLTHTSGLGNYMEHPSYPVVRHSLRAHLDAMELVARMPPAYEPPGGRHAYSNSGFVVLGRIVELVTGREFEAHLKQTILEPSGMGHTGFRNGEGAEPRAPKQARPYFMVSSALYQDVTEGIFPGFADGGIWASGPDLMKLHGSLRGGAIVSREGLALMETPYVETQRPAVYYGYGREIYGAYVPGVVAVGHSGGGHGYNTEWVRVGEYSVVLITNVRYPRAKLWATWSASSDGEMRGAAPSGRSRRSRRTAAAGGRGVPSKGSGCA